MIPVEIEDFLFRERANLIARIEVLNQAVIALVRVGGSAAQDAVLQALSDAAIVADRRHDTTPKPVGGENDVARAWHDAARDLAAMINQALPRDQPPS